MEKFTFKSSNNINTLQAFRFSPSQKAIGIIVYLHGMADRAQRFHEFAEYLSHRGFLVVGYDQLGHGESTKTLGYIPTKEGAIHLVGDCVNLLSILKNRNQGLPIFLLGFSMGAQVAKLAAGKFNHLKGLILIGTTFKTPGISFGMMLTKHFMRKNGELALAKEVDSMAFKNINKTFEPKRTVSDWLSKDEKEVDGFVNDPLCCYLFTNTAYLTMLKLIKSASQKKNLLKISRDTAILNLTGDFDVSNKRGKSAKKLTTYLLGKKYLVDQNIYFGARHDLLHETNRSDVFQDIYNWLSEHK